MKLRLLQSMPSDSRGIQCAEYNPFAGYMAILRQPAVGSWVSSGNRFSQDCRVESRIQSKGMSMEIMGILLIFLCLACVVFVVFLVRALWQCWTGLLVVSEQRCFYVCGYQADDLLGLSSPHSTEEERCFWR